MVQTRSQSLRGCSMGWAQALAWESDLVGHRCVTGVSYFTLLSPRGWLGELKEFEDRSFSTWAPCSVSCTAASESSLELAKKMLISWLHLDLHVTWARLSKLERESKTERSECVPVIAGRRWDRTGSLSGDPGESRLGWGGAVTTNSWKQVTGTNTSPRGEQLFLVLHSEGWDPRLGPQTCYSPSSVVGGVQLHTAETIFSSVRPRMRNKFTSSVENGNVISFSSS